MNDRSKWPPGPWHDEPDELRWIDPTTSLPCTARRNDFGAWCGYVGVPETHPWHGKGYDHRVPLGEMERAALDRPVGTMSPLAIMCNSWGGSDPDTVSLGVLLDCHGGITWKGVRRSEDSPLFSNAWWFGFDCSHCDDYSPSLDRHMEPGCHYRDVGYVVREVTKLAKQLTKFGGKQGDD